MVDVHSLACTHIPREILKYLLHGEIGVTNIATELEEMARQQPESKFSKRDVYYISHSLVPPFMWSNRCGRCRFWREGGPGEPGRCHIVGREDDPKGGKAIHPNGFCALHTPPKYEPAFAWLLDRLHPNGAMSVRGEYTPSVTMKRRMRRRRRHTEGDVRVQAEKGDAPPSGDDTND